MTAVAYHQIEVLLGPEVRTILVQVPPRLLACAHAPNPLKSHAPLRSKIFKTSVVNRICRRRDHEQSIRVVRFAMQLKTDHCNGLISPAKYSKPSCQYIDNKRNCAPPRRRAIGFKGWLV